MTTGILRINGGHVGEPFHETRGDVWICQPERLCSGSSDLVTGVGREGGVLSATRPCVGPGECLLVCDTDESRNVLRHVDDSARKAVENGGGAQQGVGLVHQFDAPAELGAVLQPGVDAGDETGGFAQGKRALSVVPMEAADALQQKVHWCDVADEQIEVDVERLLKYLRPHDHQPVGATLARTSKTPDQIGLTTSSLRG